MADHEMQTVEVHLTGFDMQSVKEFETFIKSDSAVLTTSRHLSFQDGISTRDLAQTAQQIKVIIEFALGTAVVKAVGSTALDLAKDRIKEWLKKRGEESAETTLLYGPDGQPLVKVKKKDLR
jgi:hypothetical protein